MCIRDRPQNPARGGRGPSTPNRPNGLVRRALHRRKSQNPIPQFQAQEAPRAARRLLRLAVRQG
eukprot:9275188-Alexandrium_andersonii.AAC.1